MIGSKTTANDANNVNVTKHQRRHHRQPYRSVTCQRMCVQKHVISSCQCYDTSLPFVTSLSTDENDKNLDATSRGLEDGTDQRGRQPKPCRLNDEFPDSCMNTASDDCLEALMAMYNRTECVRRTRDAVTRNTTLMAQCGCHPPCDEVQYDVSYSLSKWPSTGFDGENAYYDMVYVEKFPDRLITATTDKRLKAVVRNYFDDSRRHQMIKDLVRLNVFVADATAVVTKESVGFPFSELMAEIGGQMALWLGLSIIGMFEVVELLLKLLLHSLISRSHHCRSYKLSSIAIDSERGVTDSAMCSASSLQLIGLGTTADDIHR